MPRGDYHGQERNVADRNAGQNAKSKEKPYKLFDGGGLYLEVATSGSRIWRLKFRQAVGKENRLTFGPYPEITLQEAREKRLEARRLMLKGR